MQPITWTDFKTKVDARNLQIQYTGNATDQYYLITIEGPVVWSCHPTGADDTDFVNNYKSSANITMKNRVHLPTRRKMFRDTTPFTFNHTDAVTYEGYYAKSDFGKKIHIREVVIFVDNSKMDVRFLIDSIEIFTIDCDAMENLYARDTTQYSGATATQLLETFDMKYAKQGGLRVLAFNLHTDMITDIEIKVRKTSGTGNRTLSGYWIIYEDDL